MRLNVGLLLAPLLAAAAGCGSAAPPGGGNPGSASAANDAPFRYAQCMRNHGLPNFPDPHVTSSPGQTSVPGRTSSQASVRMVVPASMASAPKFRSAQKACGGILPGPNARPDHQGPGAAVLLPFARCLRSHGVSGFPDPNPQGQITPQMLSAAAVNLHTTLFLDAAKACIGVTHGAITPADIRAAISGPH